MKCEHCKKELQPLNPKVEEYIEHKFCINIFGWKLMLLRDTIEYGCIDCIIEETQDKEIDGFADAVTDIISNEIEKGNLIPKQ